MAYDSSLPQNGVNMNVGAPLSVPYTRFGAQPVGSYAMPGSQWVPGYMMAQPVAQVDDQVNIVHSNEIISKHIQTNFMRYIFLGKFSTCKWLNILV